MGFHPRTMGAGSWLDVFIDRQAQESPPSMIAAHQKLMEQLAPRYTSLDGEMDSEADEEDEVPATDCAQEADQLILEDNVDSVSKFLYDVPGKLCWSERQGFFQLDVFWSSGDHGKDSETTPALSSPLAEALPDDKNDATMGKIKTALQLFHLPCLETLVQFWAPVVVGNQIMLSNSHLPFGIRYLSYDIGGQLLLLYRKQSMRHKYYIADWDERNEYHFGPPGRVYCSGLAEYNPYVVDYSVQEFPLRDLALCWDAKTYLGLPVFESRGQRCVGVLEAVTAAVLDKRSRLRPYLEGLEKALEVVGLTLDISLSKYDVNHARKEIEDGLKVVCKAHRIPLAQTWVAKHVGYDGGTIFDASKGPFYEASKKYSSFRGACKSDPCKVVKGVVGKAFSSFTSCFCKDVSQLREKEYSFAHQAGKVNLTSCFAICLRSSYTRYSVYTLEFFLPVNDQIAREEPWTFLDSLIYTMKHNFPSFKIASGLELGKELSVEVIKLSEDNKFDSFKICQTTEFPLRLDSSPDEGQNMQPCALHHQLALEVDTASPRQSITASTRAQEFSPNEGDRMQLDQANQSLPSDPNAIAHGGEKIAYGPRHEECVIASTDEEGTVETFNWGNKITLEVLKQHSGKKLDEVAKILGVSRSTLKRICRKHKIYRWPSYKRKKVKRSTCITDANKQMAQDCCRDHQVQYSISTPKGDTNLNVHPLPQVTTMQNQSPMTIKAKCGEDMIMFDLSGSSTMTGLVDEVVKRLKLQIDKFKVKFLDEENDWILLACDEDLYKCMRSMKSLGRTTVRMVIEPII